jgi:hypothetical protein
VAAPGGNITPALVPCLADAALAVGKHGPSAQVVGRSPPPLLSLSSVLRRKEADSSLVFGLVSPGIRRNQGEKKKLLLFLHCEKNQGSGSGHGPTCIATWELDDTPSDPFRICAFCFPSLPAALLLLAWMSKPIPMPQKCTHAEKTTTGE